jgi:hypothetical protein
MANFSGMKTISSARSAAFVVAITLLLLAFLTPGDASPRGVSHTDRSAVETVAPGLNELIGVFQESQEAMDRLPLRGALPADLQPGENPLLARRIGGATGPAAYAWPMRDGVCKTARFGGGCSPISLLAKEGVLIGLSVSGSEKAVYVDALAIDGIDRVSFTLESGTKVDAELTKNAFEVRLPEAPRRAEWHLPDGSLVTNEEIGRVR